jgi:uncharacterized protein YjdB
MGSEQKPKEIKIKLSIDVEDAKKKKWNELTLKEKGIQISWCIFSLSLFAEVLLCIIYTTAITIVVLLVTTVVLSITRKEPPHPRHAIALALG